MTVAYAVTGGTGFLGAAIVDQLVRKGAPVRALARKPDQLRTKSGLVVPVRGALEDAAALTDLCAGAGVVIHCAGLTHARRDAEFHAVNAEGARRVAKAAAKAGARLVLISSMAARRPTVSAYAASKRAGEDLVAEAMSDAHWCALRAPAIYGPADQATLPYFRLVKSGFAPEPAAEPPPRASILYVEDVAAAVVQAADFPPANGFYEIGDERADGYSWREIGETLAATLGVKAARIRAPRSILEGFSALAAGSVRLFGGAPMVTPGKIAEFFHADWVARDNMLSAHSAWRPRTPLAEGFAKTVRWYKENGLL
ncbi:MAG: SDR family NAD(P)-dependent oxidoreductase [Parvularculaceae bacterium]|nr:SDR family NAD(P)-dependent oxidoreductase [Parvularculaceae bacterium]